MAARCGKVLIIIALVATTGLHWAAFQSLAWASMLASNLRTEPVSIAVQNTFDGEHPCCLCKAIAAGKKTQKKSEAALASIRIEFPPVVVDGAMIAPAHFPGFPRIDLWAPSTRLEPPTPPPRLLPV
jgi:hypothetical protein